MIKVNIITGFLGSGKTTFIKNMLSNSDITSNEKVVIIENDFGESVIDSKCFFNFFKIK